MKRQLLALGALAALVWAGAAWAQGVRDSELVYTKASKGKVAYKGLILEDSPRGLKLKGGKILIPAEEIEDVDFQLTAAQTWLGRYRQGREAEKQARTAKKDTDRKKNLAEAIGHYEAAAAVQGHPYAKSQIDYKLAYMKYLLARQDGSEDLLKAAAQQLTAFATQHPKAWQLVRALHLLADMQLELKQYGEAEKAYQALAKADVPDAVRHEAEVQALLVTMKTGKFADAEAKLRSLVGKLPKGPEQIRARLALGECLAEAKKVPEAQGVLKKVLDEAKDKQQRAQAYNSLGYCYYLGEQWQDARWEFLWVDTIYNQDKAQHAKALYYLADIFARLGEGDRSRQCRETLINDPDFAGTEYQRRAKLEEKAK